MAAFDSDAFDSVNAFDTDAFDFDAVTPTPFPDQGRRRRRVAVLFFRRGGAFALAALLAGCVWGLS